MKFHDKTVYQIYVRSFYDTSGNGYGDLKGVIEKMAYIASLGVGYIWLNPIYPSPQNDNGYDVSDYCAIDPLFGDMKDFKNLVNKASKYNIGIILDMVFNHTSTEHSWFKKALAGDPYYKDFYCFLPAKADGSEPTNWISKFGGSAWQKVDKEYYLHLYDKTQADLKWANPNVRKELYNVLDFWMQKGVKGFRFDVINVISKPSNFEDDFEGDGKRFYTDGKMMDNYLKEMNSKTFGRHKLITVGEMSATTPQHCASYSNGDGTELSMVFHFHHLKTDYENGEKWTKGILDFNSLKNLFHQWQEFMDKNNAWDALFWNNHDQPRALTRFASKKKEFHYQSATMLASTIHFMRGTPYIYMGEEIGMTNPNFEDIADYKDIETHNYYKILTSKGMNKDEVMSIIKDKSRDNSRTPMQWTNGKNAGFTTETPWIKTAENKDYINVSQEEKSKNGILTFYKQLISLRKQYEVIQTGTYTALLESSKQIIAYQRENEHEYLICFNNFFEEQITISKQELKKYQGLKPIVIASNYQKENINLEEDIVLKAYETLVVLIKK